MSLLNPVLGNIRPDILTPQEKATVAGPAPSAIGQTYEFDRSAFKKINLDLAITGGLAGLEDARAESQTTGQLVGKGLGNLVGTALFEVAKLPGYFVGGLGAAVTGDIEPMVNNFYLNGLKAAQEATQEKWFEVYTPKEVAEGNLAKQLSNPYFWMNEGANGVGFLLSFLVPGQAIKAFGLGAKGAAALGRAGKLAEVVADGEKILQGGNAFGKVMLKTLGKSGRALDFGQLASKIESSAAVTANTFFESAAEASELYDKMLGQGASKEEASHAAAQAFKLNVGVLAVSNALVERYIFDGFGRSLLKPRQLTSEVITGAKEISRSMLGAAVKKMPYAIGAGIIQEGLLEEGLQSTIQQTNGGSIGEIVEKYRENMDGMFSDDEEAIEFGKSVVLGGALGGGMSVGGAVGEAKRENRFLFGSTESKPNRFRRFLGQQARQAQPGAIELLRAGYKSLKADKSEIFSFDGAGKISGFNSKVKEKLKDAASLELMSNYYNDLLVQNGGDVGATNTQFVEDLEAAGAKPQDAIKFRQVVEAPQGLSNAESIAYIEHQGHKRYFDNFLAMEGGAQVAEAHMEDMLQAMQDRYEGTTGVKMEANKVDDLRSTLKKELEDSIRLHEFIQADHSQQRIGFNPVKKDDPNPKETVQKYVGFFNRAKTARLELLRDIAFFENRYAQMEEGTEEEPNTEREDIAEVIKDMKERYKKLSTKSGLAEIWDKWQSVDAEIDQNAKDIETLGDESTDPEDIDEAEVIDPNEELPQNREGSAIDSVDGVEQDEEEQSLDDKLTERDRFWMQLIEAGYNVVDNPDGTKGLDDELEVHIRGKNNKPVILSAVTGKDGKTKLSLTDAANPTKTKLFDNIRAIKNHLGKLEIIPKAEILDARRAKIEEEQRQLLREREAKTREGLIELMDQLSQADDAIAVQLEQVNTEIQSSVEKLKNLNKSKKAEVKIIRDEVAAEVRRLEDLRDALINKRKILQTQLDTIQLYMELSEDASLKEVLDTEKEIQSDLESYKGEFENYDIPKLQDAINGIDDEIVKIERRIAYVSKIKMYLEDVLLRAETDFSVLGKEQTKEFRWKYHYKNSKGTAVFPPDFAKNKNELARGEVAPHIHKHLDKLASITGQDPEALKREFIKDAENLQVSNEVNLYIERNGVEGLMDDFVGDLLKTTNAQIAQLQKEIGDLIDKKTLIDSIQRIKAYEISVNGLNLKFRQSQRKKIAREVDETQKISSRDGGENNYTPRALTEDDPFFGHALASELYGSTGVNILYDRNGNDMYEKEGDVFRPVANPNIHQRTFFRWVETANTKDFKVEARVAFYDSRDGELEAAFKDVNPNDQLPGEDVFIVILDKKGQVMKVDDVPLFTGMRKSTTKFPVGKKPKMNMLSLMDLYLRQGLSLKLSVTREMMASAVNGNTGLKIEEIKAFAEVLGVPLEVVGDMQLSELFDKLEAYAINWGRETYDTFLGQIRSTYKPGEVSVMLPVVGITQGHPVRILDEEKQIVTYNPMESLGLELHPNGRPKNFTILKANYKGNITVGNKSKGGFQPGVIYIKKNGSENIVPIMNDQLNSNEADLMLFILSKMAGQFSMQGTAGVDIPAEYPEGMNLKVNGQVYGQGSEIKLFPQVKDKFSVVNMLMMWGSNSANGTQDIFIKDGILFYGNKSVSVAAIAKGVNVTATGVEATNIAAKDVLAFLQGRRFHISFDMMSAAKMQGGKYYHPTLKNGKIVFEEHASYLEYVFTRTKSDVVPRSVLDGFGLPQFAQRNIQFGSLTARPEEAKVPLKQTTAKKAPKKAAPASQAPPASTPPAVTDPKADLIKKLQFGLTETGDKRLYERAKAAGLTDAQLSELLDNGILRRDDIEALGFVPPLKPKATKGQQLSRRALLTKYGGVLNVLEAIGLVGGSQVEESTPIVAEESTAPQEVQDEATSPTSEIPATDYTGLIQDGLSANREDLENARIALLESNGYTTEEILALVSDGYVDARKVVADSNLLGPEPTKKGKVLSQWRGSMDKTSEFVALMNIPLTKPGAVQPEPESEVVQEAETQIPRSVNDRLAKIVGKAQERKKGRLSAKDKFDTPTEQDQRKSVTELLDEFLNEGIIEQNCK